MLSLFKPRSEVQRLTIGRFVTRSVSVKVHTYGCHNKMVWKLFALTPANVYLLTAGALCGTNLHGPAGFYLLFFAFLFSFRVSRIIIVFRFLIIVFNKKLFVFAWHGMSH